MKGSVPKETVVLRWWGSEKNENWQIKRVSPLIKLPP